MAFDYLSCNAQYSPCDQPPHSSVFVLLMRRHCEFCASAFVVVQPTLCNGFLFCVETHGFRAVSVVIAHQALFPSTEAMEGHRHGNGNIHANHSYLNTMRKFSRYLSIPREDRGAITIFMFVNQLQCAGKIGDANHAEHRSEDLFLIDTHGRRDAIEQRAADEEALFATSDLVAAAVDDELGTGGDAVVD